MRFVSFSCAAILLGACFNVTDPDHPAPIVDPPVIACGVPVPDCGASPFGATDAEADADADTDADAASATCDAGPAPWYNPCQLPPSVCADSHWAAYFDNGTCVNGTCQLVTKYHYCATGCQGGGCVSNGPTAPSRGF